jgi:hypothetical protein
MNSKNENDKLERLDEIGQELTRASLLSEREIRETVSQPFIYARIRARIAEQGRSGAVENNNWWAGLLTAWRPLAGMAVMAIIAATLFLFSAVAGTNGSLGPAASDDDSLAIGESGFERIITDGEPLSNDEVLATIMNQDEMDVRR